MLLLLSHSRVCFGMPHHRHRNTRALHFVFRLVLKYALKSECPMTDVVISLYVLSEDSFASAKFYKHICFQFGLYL